MNFLKEKVTVLKHDDKEYTIPIDKVSIARHFTGDEKQFEAQSRGDIMLIMSKTLDADCIEEGLARDAMGKVQQLRKTVGLTIEQKVDVWYETDASSVSLQKAFQNKIDLITKRLRTGFLPKSKMPATAKVISGTPQTFEIKKEKLTIYLSSR